VLVERTATMGPLIPPFRYMPVEDGVYRSAYPTEKVCNVGAQGASAAAGNIADT
jgi:hypothetical protein